MTVEEGLIIDKEVFAVFADIYPQEVEEAYPDEFWEYFHAKIPNISREKMKELLKEKP